MYERGREQVKTPMNEVLYLHQTMRHAVRKEGTAFRIRSHATPHDPNFIYDFYNDGGSKEAQLLNAAQACQPCGRKVTRPKCCNTQVGCVALRDRYTSIVTSLVLWGCQRLGGGDRSECAGRDTEYINFPCCFCAPQFSFHVKSVLGVFEMLSTTEERERE